MNPKQLTVNTEVFHEIELDLVLVPDVHNTLYAAS